MRFSTMAALNGKEMLQIVSLALSLNNRRDIEQVEVTEEWVRLWKEDEYGTMYRACLASELFHEHGDYERRHVLQHIRWALKELDQKLKNVREVKETLSCVQTNNGKYAPLPAMAFPPVSAIIPPVEASATPPSVSEPEPEPEPEPAKAPWVRDLDLGKP